MKRMARFADILPAPTVAWALLIAFALPAVGSFVGIRLGANWLSLMPVVITMIPFLSHRRAFGKLVSILSVFYYSALLVLMSLTIGRYFVPSFAALIIGTIMQLSLFDGRSSTHSRLNQVLASSTTTFSATTLT